VVGGVGALQLLARQRQHAGNVGGDVAVADHDDALAAEVVSVVGEVRMRVVPIDELGGRVAAGQVLTGDSELAVGRGAVGEQDRVIALPQLLDADVITDRHVPEEAELGAGRGLLVDPDHRLDLGMVGRDARADQAEGGRQLVEHVHLDDRFLGLDQLFRRVEAGRARADDRDAKWVLLCSELRHASRKG
jgi:hypothetical protein